MKLRLISCLLLLLSSDAVLCRLFAKRTGLQSDLLCDKQFEPNQGLSGQPLPPKGGQEVASNAIVNDRRPIEPYGKEVVAQIWANAGKLGPVENNFNPWHTQDPVFAQPQVKDESQPAHVSPRESAYTERVEDGTPQRDASTQQESGQPVGQHSPSQGHNSPQPERKEQPPTDHQQVRRVQESPQPEGQFEPTTEFSLRSQVSQQQIGGYAESIRQDTGHREAQAPEVSPLTGPPQEDQTYRQPSPDYPPPTADYTKESAGYTLPSVDYQPSSGRIDHVRADKHQSQTHPQFEVYPSLAPFPQKHHLTAGQLQPMSQSQSEVYPSIAPYPHSSIRHNDREQPPHLSNSQSEVYPSPAPIPHSPEQSAPGTATPPQEHQGRQTIYQYRYEPHAQSNVQRNPHPESQSPQQSERERKFSFNSEGYQPYLSNGPPGPSHQATETATVGADTRHEPPPQPYHHHEHSNRIIHPPVPEASSSSAFTQHSAASDESSRAHPVTTPGYSQSPLAYVTQYSYMGTSQSSSSHDFNHRSASLPPPSSSSSSSSSPFISPSPIPLSSYSVPQTFPVTSISRIPSPTGRPHYPHEHDNEYVHHESVHYNNTNPTVYDKAAQDRSKSDYLDHSPVSKHDAFDENIHSYNYIFGPGPSRDDGRVHSFQETHEYHYPTNRINKYSPSHPEASSRVAHPVNDGGSDYGGGYNGAERHEHKDPNHGAYQRTYQYQRYPHDEGGHGYDYKLEGENGVGSVRHCYGPHCDFSPRGEVHSYSHTPKYEHNHHNHVDHLDHRPPHHSIPAHRPLPPPHSRHRHPPPPPHSYPRHWTPHAPHSPVCRYPGAHSHPHPHSRRPYSRHNDVYGYESVPQETYYGSEAFESQIPVFPPFSNGHVHYPWSYYPFAV